ncbi:hypothetical protein Egran_05379 [Elaphomyces granulatus]|uniref:RAD52 homolog n=1 Tax=Elaphomyces granulatus TaxID=519963 RepID=A0A232LRS1_9EURO|nr:hypothetical protein Egran_05379 [Elaphomyces granulatus]
MPTVGDQHRGGIPAITASSFEEQPRRIREYTTQEIATLQARLSKQLGPEYISSRPGPPGQKIYYVTGEKCISLANELFGFNGWSSSIQNIQVDYVEECPQTGRISIGVHVIVRVTLKDGTYHEDLGYGCIDNCKGKAAAFQKAKKEGITDGLKRALRTFGNALGNCIYDREYIKKISRVKATPAKWNVDNLHRHPDYAPVEKEPAGDNSKRLAEDNDLPPRAAEASLTNTDDTLTFEADAEFGSDLFDEVDLVVATTGSPDEIICLDPDPPRNQQLPPPAAQVRPQGNISRPLAQDIVTASKPENSWIAGPTTRQQPATPHRAVSPALRQNMPPNHPAVVQRKAAAPQQYRQNALANHAQSKAIQESASNVPGGLGAMQPETSNNPTMTKNQSNDVQGQAPQGSPLNAENKLQTDPSKGFYSARAVDMLRENPAAPTAPQFDPRFESPSIRKTAGVDHSRSIPITKPMLAASTSTASNNRAPVNPSTDMHRRVGAPGGGGISNPIGRGQSTSSYRPLTRPNTDTRNIGTGAALNGTNLGMGGNGKRPPLDDVTNATSGPAGLVQSKPAIQKRHRVGDEENPNATVLQQ